MLKQLHHRVTRYFGRRGGILTLFGFCWIVIGFGFATIKMERFSRPGAGGPLEFMDSIPWPGVFWILCGIIALVNGLIRRRIHNDDALGYAVLIMPPTFWMLAYMWSFILWLLTQNEFPEPYGRQSGYIGAAVYLIVVIIVRIVANWTDDFDVEEALKHDIIVEPEVDELLHEPKRKPLDNGGHGSE